MASLSEQRNMGAADPQAVGKAAIRPFHLTPDRLLIGLLAVEGFLLLSEQFRCLTRLRTLNLDLTQVTDAGLEHLKGLRRLEWLQIEGCDVTRKGVERLQHSLPDCGIDADPDNNMSGGGMGGMGDSEGSGMF